MCGRYASDLPADLLTGLFAITDEDAPEVPPSWNKAPSQLAPVVRWNPKTRTRHLDTLRWGLIPHWTKDPSKTRQPINARSETAESSPMFKGALLARRCLVPMDAFYEWQRTPRGKQPYAIARGDNQPLAVGGVWEGWRDPEGDIVRTFAILTTDANAIMRPIHDRMPLIVEPDDWPVWLGETDGDWRAIMRPSRAPLRVWPVSTRVNSPANDGPDLLRPAEAPPSAEQGAPNSA